MYVYISAFQLKVYKQTPLNNTIKTRVEEQISN